MSSAAAPALIRETFPVGPLQCNCNNLQMLRYMKDKGF